LSKSLVVPLGVVVAWEAIDHPWQTERWRPINVFMHPPGPGNWRELVRGNRFVHYHATTIDLELHRKDAASYRVNLTHGDPSIFVVLRERDDAPQGEPPVMVHLATASPFDAESHGFGGDEIVEGVAMPDALRSLIEDFVDLHHVEERFVKRQRDKTPIADLYQFGQEPIHELRRRMDDDTR